MKFVFLLLFVISGCASYHDKNHENSNYAPLVSPTLVIPPGYRHPSDPLSEPGSPESLQQMRIPMPREK